MQIITRVLTRSQSKDKEIDGGIIGSVRHSARALQF